MEQSRSPIRLLFTDLDREIERRFQEIVERQHREVRAADWEPHIDVIETEDAYIIEADLPGVSRDALQVRIEGHEITICGERAFAMRLASARGVRLERQHGRFCRRFSLTSPVDVNHVEVSESQGVFRIVLPKLT